MSRKVYIAADSIVSPLWLTSVDNFEAVCQGRTGLRKVIIPGAQPIETVASIIPDELFIQASQKLNSPQRYTRFETLLIASIIDALSASGIDPASSRTAIVISTTKGNIDMLREDAYAEIDQKRLYLAELGKAVAAYFGNPNTPVIISNACISGVMAIITGSRMIRSGRYDHVIVCGGDIINDFTASGFRSFKALSEEACKPFDKDRTGLNLGEAFATVILSAEKGEGRVEVIGGASSNDANHISGPARDGGGLKLAISNALMESNITASDIGFISAHGTATPYNDEMEAIAFDDLGFGSVPVNSLKGYFGHTLGGAGLVESIISIHALKSSLLIGTLGFENHGVTRGINIIQHTQPASVQVCLKTASGFGGCNAAVIFTKV